MSINLAMFRKISQFIQSSLNSDDIYHAIFEIIDTALDFDSATLYILNEETDVLDIACQKGESVIELAQEFQFGKGHGISGWISSYNKETLIFSSFTKSKVDRGFKSFVSIPLITENRLLGVLNLGHKEEDKFSDDDRDAFIVLGTQVALIADTLRLQQKINLKNDELNYSMKELQQSQSDLVNKERLAAIGELVVSVNHEINNPLSAIIGFLGILMRRLDADEGIEKSEILKILEKIKDSGMKIKDVTHRLTLIQEIQLEQYSKKTRMTKIPENK